MRFVKKPIEVEAWQIPPIEPVDCVELPAWVVEAVVSGVVRAIPGAGVFIDTREGTMAGAVGDWVVRGIDGELYAVEKSIFERTYDPV